ncbi:MAG: hypothetical protein GX096_14615 [Clostridiales bacterium]|nr:hypothetical protein [Clostridiales bacterium]
MKKKNVTNTTAIAFLIVGIITMAYGVVGHLQGTAIERHVEKLLGMFAGAGFALMVLGIAMLVIVKLSPKEKIEQAEVEMTDERNIAISRAAGLVGFAVSVVVLVVLAFTLTAMGYLEASLPCIIGLYVSVISFAIAQRVYQKKM